MDRIYKLQSIFTGQDVDTITLYQVSGSVSSSISSSISDSGIVSGSDLESGILVKVCHSASAIKLEVEEGIYKLHTLPEYEYLYRHLNVYADSGDEYGGTVKSSLGGKSYSLKTPIEDSISIEAGESVYYVADSKPGFNFRGWYTSTGGTGTLLERKNSLLIESINFTENTSYVTSSFQSSSNFEGVPECYFAYFT